ncbi:MAG: HlyD family secretion protein [Geminicoccaceae bacterium]
MALDEDRHDSLVSDPDPGATEMSGSQADRMAPAPLGQPPSHLSQAFQKPEHAYPTKRKRPVRKLVFGALLVGAAAYGGHLGYDWWTDGRFLVGTDDAYVQGDITILAAKMKGYVAAVEVANNQRVQAGDVIARLDDGDYRLALESAQGKLATQESAIARIGRQIEAAAAGVAKAEAGLDSAQADATHAAAEYQRQVQLTRADFASKARLDEAVFDRDRSQAAIRSAEAELDAERANVEVLRAQQAEAEQLATEERTKVAMAERDLSFTIVRAPVDGVVGNKAVQVGSYLEPGTRLAALVPLASVHVDANFKETQLGEIRPGQTVRLEVDAYPGREFEGTVESVAPASGSVFSLLPPENATGNFTKIVQRVPVRIALDPAMLQEGILRAGLSVVAKVDTRTAPAEPAVASN